MFRLLRLLFGLASFVALVYFAATVPLGSRTLLGHLWAIGHTQEARDLANGSREEAGKVAGKVRQILNDDKAGGECAGSGDKAAGDRRSDDATRANSSGSAAPARPLERIDEHDRRRLEHLVRRQPAK